MPAGLPPTPWIQGYNHPELFLQGYGQGSQAAQARARLQQAAMEQAAQMQMAQQKLAQDAQQTQIELDMKQRLAEQNHLQEQQRIEIAKQYHEQQVGLAQDRLKETALMDQQKIQSAARRFQVEGVMNQEVEEAVKGGADVQQARIAALFRHGAELGMTGAGYASMAGHVQARTPEGALQLQQVNDPITKKPIAGMGAYPGPSGRLSIQKTIDPETSPESMKKFLLQEKLKKADTRLETLERQRVEYPKSLTEEEWDKRINEAKKQISDTYKQFGQEDLSPTGPVGSGATIKYILGKGFVPIK